MSKHRPNTKGYVKEHRDSKRGLMLIVGADDLSDAKNPYHGPRADIYWDETWLHIVTDSYEGHVMLNIEALPHLRLALGKISRVTKAAAST